MSGYIIYVYVYVYMIQMKSAKLVCRVKFHYFFFLVNILFHASSLKEFFFFAMIKNHLVITRYFIFTKINPTDDDFNRLYAAANEVDAFLGYSYNRIGKSNKHSLVGFLILRKSPTNAGRLISHLPNFILKPAKSKDFAKCCKGYIVLHGNHPLNDIKKLLFEESKFY